MSEQTQIDILEPVFFYDGKNEWACFSNFYRSEFELYDKKWATIEHFYQAMKAGEDEQAEENIRLASTPAKAKSMGRRVQMAHDFEANKYAIMIVGLRTKFKNIEMRGKLLASGDRPIYEDSPVDKIWGTGVLHGIGSGKNLLGKALMRVRDEIRNEG